jgi:hypothetical protein
MPRTLSPEHKKKLAAGRVKAAAKKKKERAKGAASRVQAYRDWVKADAAYYRTPREERQGKPPVMPPVPYDQDWKDVGAAATNDVGVTADE